ncbi:MAG: CRP-like cAMP-binding protein [Crocinitomicaceae bacterium]|jgi:CRP-like cAMP-binding protein
MKKILVIEDNQAIRENTAEILELADFEVITAEDGKIGVEMAKSTHPDLIICDIMMPHLDGYGVLKILNKNPNTSRIPFIFLTAKSEKSDFRKGMGLGADDYIVKPFEDSDLLDAVEIRLKRSVEFQENFDNNVDGLNSFIEKSRGIEELSDLSKERKEKEFLKKKEIFREDDHANYLYFIISGKVKCEKTDTYGKSFVTEIYNPGDFLGYLSLLEGSEYKSTAVAMENTRVAIIPKDDFLQLIQKNKDVSSKFIKMLSGNVIDREKRLLHLAYSPVGERVAQALYKLANNDENKKANTANINLSREDLANIVGTAKETLIRMLSELKKEGVIELVGRQISVVDMNRLKSSASDF